MRFPLPVAAALLSACAAPDAGERPAEERIEGVCPMTRTCRSGPAKCRKCGMEPANLRIRLRTAPDPPLAAEKTMLFFDPEPGRRSRRVLGAWGHMLIASSDLIDTIHRASGV